MRLKSSPLCCAFAWSPTVLGNPPFLATASYSGTMDENFSNDAFLEIRRVDVKVTDETELPVEGRVRLPDRALRVDWSPYGGPKGIIGVACGNGCVYIFSAAKVLEAGPNGGSEEPSDQPRALLWMEPEHAGSAVRGFHFNPSKPHFLATGADDGVWRVWTLQDGATGAVCRPTKVSVIANVPNSGAIVHLQWHPKYAHIFATATASGVVNVWNLKMATRVTALNVSKASHGAQITAIAWNPTAATQLVVGLDDRHPVLQVWDLRTGVVPLREMCGHTGGITGLAWSEQESSMVASCGGDGRTMWWDPNTGEKLGELQPVGHYLVDVQWCPVLPAVIATSAFTPLLCVSTAQDVFSAGGEKLGAVHKWLNKPCGASVNMSLAVAALAPGSEHDIVLTSLHSVPMSPKTSEDQQMLDLLARFPSGSPERTQWLRDTHHELLAAFSSAQNTRQPILDFLNAGALTKTAGDGGSAAVKGGDDNDDPFAAISQENQKSFEDRSSELIVSGQIEAAVDLCMDEHSFDDAFAVAFLSGGELVRKVHQRYIAHIAATNPKKRHVLYAGAIASGDFRPLIQASVPWKEVLSAIVAFVVGDGFADACNLLGDALRDQKNYEGAYHCYVCARNVDAVVDLWRLERRPSREVVQDTILLEETTQRAASGEYLAHCMCDYGVKMLTDRHPEQALQYLQRAARIGDHTAAVLVDRMKYLFNLPQPESGAPYAPAPVSDEQSPACQAFLAAAEERRMREVHEQQQAQSQAMALQQQQQQQQHQQQPQQYHANPMSMPGAGAPPPQPGYARGPAPPPPSGAQGFQQQMPPPPPQQQQPYMPPAQPQPPQQHQHQPSLMPNRQQGTPGVAPLGAGANPMAASRPPLMPGAGGAPLPMPALSHASSMYGNGGTPMNQSMNGAAAPSALMQPQQQQMIALPPSRLNPPTPAAMAAPLSSTMGPPKPRLMPHPVSTYSSMRTPTTGGTQTGAAPPPPPPMQQQAQMPPPSPAASSSPPRAPSQPASLYNVTAAPPAPMQPPPQQPLPYASAPPPMQRPGMGGPPPPPPPSSAAGPPPQAQQQQPQPGAPSIMAFNPAQFAYPLQSQLVQRLQQLIPSIADPRRRGAVEGAAVEAVRQMQQGMLPEELVQMLMNFCSSAGTPNATPAWVQLSGRYAGAVQGFVNLRYL